MDEKKDIFWGMDVRVLEKDEKKIVYTFAAFKNEVGKMTTYNLFPGITIIFNDFKTSVCCENKGIYYNYMEFNHCRKGRFECEFNKSNYAYLGEGEISINMLSSPSISPKFPLGYYNGISFLIDLSVVPSFVSNIWDDINIDFYNIRDKFCPNNTCSITKTPEKMERFFNELYEFGPELSQDVNIGYLRIKAIEFFYLLNNLAEFKSLSAPIYFSSDIVNKVRAVKDKLTLCLDNELTIKDLSEEFNLGETKLKNCFKAVYGKTIYSYRREYRIIEASKILKKTTLSISEISGLVGYENPSKFSAAFKEVMKVSPSIYRKI